jgi:hypothetical protein
MPTTIRKLFSLSTLALITALTLSGIAAWYSVVGLTAIFAAAVIPIIIMGGALEFAKVITTVWLHRYWDKCRWAMKTYLTGAVIVLAIVTSMGIFGFLSKAHMDQGLPTGDVAAQIQLIDEKINIQRELIASERQNIEVARNSLKLLDEQVTARLGMGFDDGSAAERAVQIRRQQRTERNDLSTEISAAQKRIETSNAEIQKLSLEKAPLSASYRKIEAEVGPIKYIAAFIYGDNPDNATLERAVRWVIILLIFVFDPLALMLVIAAISSYKWEFEDKKEQEQLPVTNTGYLPLDETEKEETVIPVVPEPTAASYELTADGGMVQKEPEAQVKKKLRDWLKPNLASLKNFNLIKNLKINQLFTKKLNLSQVSQLVRSNLSWSNLTNWDRSPTLKLLKLIKNKIKKS